MWETGQPVKGGPCGRDQGRGGVVWLVRGGIQNEIASWAVRISSAAICGILRRGSNLFGTVDGRLVSMLLGALLNYISIIAIIAIQITVLPLSGICYDRTSGNDHHIQLDCGGTSQRESVCVDMELFFRQRLLCSEREKQEMIPHCF